MTHQAMASDKKQDSTQRSSKAWRTRKARKFRETFLQRHPYCRDCMVQWGRPVPATVIHHLVPQHVDPQGAFDPDNCIALCDACHAARHHGESEGDGG